MMPPWKCCVSILILLVYISDESKSNLVIDKYSQKSINVSEYCPAMEYCREGTHVMCMFYDKNREKGAQCLNPVNFTVTPEIAKHFLEIVNAIRSKVANAKETGFKQQRLPRAFGLPRLQWDEELATFAQVLANQCILRHDLCRATKRFPNPGQAASAVRFYYPDWLPISNISENEALNKVGFNQEKVLYAIRQSCLKWYKGKSSVGWQTVLNPSGYLLKHPHRSIGKLYLDMISGAATHMGCGLSAYVDYSYIGENGKTRSFYDLIEVVCNFSASPIAGIPVYNTKRLSNSMPSSKCGCVFGYIEDDDCLCVEDPNYTPVSKSESPYSCVGKNCVPAVVILPIIAMEDAPLHVLQQHNNQTRKHQTSLDLFSEDNFVNGAANKKAYSHDNFKKALKETSNGLDRLSEITNIDLWNAQHRYLPKDSLISQNGHKTQTLYHVRHNPKPRSKGSLFSKSNKFELPVKPQIIKDVLPRKDFKKVKNLVNVYFNNKRNINAYKPRNDATIKDRETKPTVIHEINSDISNYKNITNENTDKKVLLLLDHLEQEVKYTDLAENERRLLDDKLRKIYGHLNNIPKNSNSENNHLKKAETSDFLKYENSASKHLIKEPQRNSHRSSYSINNDKSSELSKNDFDVLSVKTRLLEKKINGNDGLGSLTKILINPVNENEYGFSPDKKNDDVYKTRNIYALAKLDPASIKLRDIGKEHNSDDIQYGRDDNRNEFVNNRYHSKNYDDIEMKEYTIHLDDIGDLDYERQKYYQDKIDFLEQKLYKSQEPQLHSKVDRQMRPIQQDQNEFQHRPNKKNTRKVSFYSPGRARSVYEY